MRFTLIMLSMLALAVAPCAAGVGAKSDDATAAEPAMKRISEVLVPLSREGNESWKKDKSWPTDKSDFAQRKNWKLSNDELVAALARPLNPDAAVDGYVKWQLLSFAPDLSAAKIDAVQRVIQYMPRITAQPEPQFPEPPRQSGITMGMESNTVSQKTIIDGRTGQKQTLNTVTSGSTMSVGGSTSADGRYVTADVIDATSTDLTRLRKVVANANVATIAYRDGLTDLAPINGGIKIGVLLRDVWQRIEAGDPSHTKAIDRLVEECQKLTPKSPIPRDVRLGLARDAEQFKDLKRQVIESFQPGREQPKNGRIKVNGYVAEFPADKLDIVVRCLRGQPAATQPAK